MTNNRIIYADDVSILEHANMVVFRNADGDTEAIYIERYEDTGQFMIYSLDLFNTPADSWINEDDLKGINSFADAKYEFNTKLTGTDQYFFTSDLCSYYGAINFDSYPNQFLSEGSFEEWLISRELITA